VTGSLRVATVNVNGIRAAVRKGMRSWLDTADVDVLTVQEVRAQTAHLAELLPDWNLVHDESPLPGRAGVAVLSRLPVSAPRVLSDTDEGMRGRWIETSVDAGTASIVVVSAYVHSGEAGTARQDAKYAFLDAMTARMADLVASGSPTVVTGDLNIAHRELDIRNWRGNRAKAGFLPRERAYLDLLLAPAGLPVPGPDDSSPAAGQGWVDVGRRFHGEVPGPYTWWSSRGRAFDTDTGWRIDYQLATADLGARVSDYRVVRAPTWDTRWSDHAPVVVDYDLRPDPAAASG
jgi:exodeoxyribonuclease-3